MRTRELLTLALVLCAFTLCACRSTSKVNQTTQASPAPSETQGYYWSFNGTNTTVHATGSPSQ